MSNLMKAALSMKRPLYTLTMGLPKSRYGYGNGVFVVPAQVRFLHTSSVISTEGKGKQLVINKDAVPVLDAGSGVNVKVKGIYQKMIQIPQLKLGSQSVNRVTNETLHTYSEEQLLALRKELKDHSFKFKPIRRIYIPKKNGGTRPLGIPNPFDKVALKAASNVLEEIYEGNEIFLDCSHGFRPGKSTHTALSQIKKWTSVKWFIEGEISKFDTINHDLLQSLLEKRIDDREFMDFYRKAVKSTYVDLAKHRIDPSIVGTGTVGSGGTDCGSMSPILSNILLHELDHWISKEFVEPCKASGKTSKPNPEYKKIHTRISNLRQYFSENYRYKRTLSPEQE